MATHRALGPSAAFRATSVHLQPTTPEQEVVVREQLERILASPVFRNSKRYASVLKYIVESTLEGNSQHLKERTIGIEVFGRAPDYDTSTDHAVRSAAAEIRKRLAQYYQEETDGSALRIELQSGSYVPQFRGQGPVVPLPVDTRIAQESSGPALALPPAPRGKFRSLWIAGLGLVAAALLVVALSFAKDDAMQKFWSPVLATRGPVLLCVGNLEGGRQADGVKPPITAPLTLADFHRSDREIIHVDDAVTLSRIAGLIQAKGKSFRIASQTDATFTDLQNGPAVLIGLMNNDWTGRLVRNQRFAVEHPARGVILIRDHDHPTRNDWAVDYSTPYLDITRDYALVLRVSDPKTDQMVVTVAGISALGTLAAGEFLTNPEEIKKIEAVAPKGWKNKNLEMVLSIDVIKGNPGRANIVAAHFW
jgi:hypothetical protein